MSEKKYLNIYFKKDGQCLPVGDLNIEDVSGLRPICYFAYDPHWLRSGFALGRDLPLVAKVFKSSPRCPLFGFLLDLIPGIGSRKLHKLIHKKDFTNIELLIHSQEALRPGALGLYPETQVALQSKGIGTVVTDLERLMMGHLNISNIDLSLIHI